MSPSFIKHFSKLKDPRIERSRMHELMDILVLIISAQIAGANGWEAIVTFGKSKIEWLRQFVPLKNGIPSPDWALVQHDSTKIFFIYHCVT